LSRWLGSAFIHLLFQYRKTITAESNATITIIITMPNILTFGAQSLQMGLGQKVNFVIRRQPIIPNNPTEPSSLSGF
jgi:hypothetical protein